MAGIRSHSLTHICWEKAIYNQRNQTSWDGCCNVAKTARRYRPNPTTKIGRSNEDELLLFTPRPIASAALERAIFNLTYRGARIPVYLVMTGFDLREYAVNRSLMSAWSVARRRDTP
jgi:hypothetical protein